MSTETLEENRARKRQKAAERADRGKAWLEKNVAGSGRLKGRPIRLVRPDWELDDHDRAHFYRTQSITSMFEQIRHKVHPSDHELVIDALSGTVAFYNLIRLIEDVEKVGNWNEYESELKSIRVGFDLGLQALDKTLRDRGMVLEGFSKGGKSKSTPAWHADCIRAARTLLEAGTASHELAGKLAQRFPHNGKTIRSVLKKAGIK